MTFETDFEAAFTRSTPAERERAVRAIRERVRRNPAADIAPALWELGIAILRYSQDAETLIEDIEQFLADQ